MISPRRRNRDRYFYSIRPVGGIPRVQASWNGVGNMAKAARPGDPARRAAARISFNAIRKSPAIHSAAKPLYGLD
jgi:hypothetical protein